jgi:alkylation response protein AidB-like acyl-CoA dehydrogenase
MGSGSTEPNAGSDNRYPPDDDPRAGYRLRAERRGDEWILNGEKAFIANGSVGKLFFVNTRTNPDVPLRDGSTVFLVPIDTPGFRIGKVFNKAGWRFYQNAELIFEDARVPHTNVVGEVKRRHEGEERRVPRVQRFRAGGQRARRVRLARASTRWRSRRRSGGAARLCATTSSCSSR